MIATCPDLRSDGGYTLAEIMVATLVMLIISGALFTSLEQTEVFYEDYSADVDLRQQARVTLTLMSDELRTLGYDIGDFDEALAVATPTQLQFLADVDDGGADGACDATAEAADNGGVERTTYTFDTDAGTLRRQVDCWNGTSWSLGVQDVVLLGQLAGDAVAFRYYDASGALLPAGGGTMSSSDREDVRSVAMDIALSDDATSDLLGDGREAELTMSQHVKLQNR